MTQQDHQNPADFSDLDDFDAPAPAAEASSALVPASLVGRTYLEVSAAAPESTKAKREKSRERAPCRKCGGSGRYNGPSSYGRTCFACSGTGTGALLTSLKAKDNKAARIASMCAGWKAANPAATGWLVANAPRSEFAASLMGALTKYGSLTENQLAAVDKCILRDVERAAERVKADVARREAEAQRAVAIEAAPTAEAPGRSLQPIQTALERAKASGLKYPFFNIQHYTFKLAPMTGRNAGAVYVTTRGTYMGKVQDGKFSPSRDAPESATADLLEIAADPLAAAVAHGRKFGQCACCGRQLTDAESVARGVGPICADRYFGG